VKAYPRFSVLVLASIVLGASACRPPVYFPEFGVDTDSNNANFAEDVALEENGEFVVTWTELTPVDDVYGRRFSAGTSPLAPPFPMDPDDVPIRRGGSIDRDASGRYVIVWSESLASDVWGRRWNADGTPIGDKFQVSTSSLVSGYAPRVASDPSGNFVVVWTENTDAVARRYDSNGVPLGDAFVVNQYTPFTQAASAVSMSAAGFVVGWRGADPNGPGVFGRMFDSAGAPITSEVRLNTSAIDGGFTFPDVAMDAGGGFVAVWRAVDKEVRARRFTSQGDAVTDDFLVHQSTAMNVRDAHVASDSAGNFLVVWDERPTVGFDGSNVFGRFYDMAGDTASDPFEISEIVTNSRIGPRPSLADDGSFVVAFDSGSGGAYDVKGRKGGVRASPQIVMDPLPTADGPGDTMGNGVFEPGETQVLETAWINDSNEAVESILGTGPLFTGPPGASYTVNDDTAFYDVLPTGVSKSCIEENDCFSVTVSNPASRPVQHWDALFQEDTNMSLPHTWVLHMGGSFPDVPPANTFYRFVETLFHKQVTGGCAGGGYCPTSPVTRAQMAVFLLKSKYGSAHIPPPCTGTVFTDVPCSGGPFDPWIEELASQQITGGCGGGNYCPGSTVTRQQMAVFLLKAFEGAAYDPPDCAGVFDDVPCTPGTGFSDWIEELATRGITGGCNLAPPLYCPTNPNNRGQMAAFLVKTFGLALYGG
jgi:hypothetical protein